MDYSKLTDAELIELEKLLRDEDIYQRREALKDFYNNKNPNYTFLADAYSKQKYIKGLDESGKEIDVLIDGKRGCVLEGSSRCFSGDTLIVTNHGNKPISEINVGDSVKTPNGFKKVLSTFKSKNTKKTIRIKLKSGHEIICTEDHKFFYKGSWIEVKHLLSLVNDKNTEF
jgi:intein/homing endonuclease